MVLESALNQTGLINDEKYQVGCILEGSWGYDQTNIDFYKIIKRKGDWLTLQAIGSKDVVRNDKDMRGTVVPDESVTGSTMRRRLFSRDGVAIGCNFNPSYGWIRAWDGKPSEW